MRKILIALALMLFMTGLVVAAEVTVLKYDADKKEVTVKEGENEKTYKIAKSVKVSKTDKDGNATEGKFEDLEKRLSKAGPDSKFKMKLDITTKDGEVTEIKYKGGKGK